MSVIEKMYCKKNSQTKILFLVVFKNEELEIKYEVKKNGNNYNKFYFTHTWILLFKNHVAKTSFKGDTQFLIPLFNSKSSVIISCVVKQTNKFITRT